MVNVSSGHSTVTYSAAVGWKLMIIGLPTLLTAATLTLLADPPPPAALALDLIFVGAWWIVAVLVLRMHTHIGNGVVQVRRIRSRTLRLAEIECARREIGKGTVVRLTGGREELFPLYLPGVRSSQFVRPDVGVLGSALKGPNSTRSSFKILRAATRGDFLPEGFKGFEEC